MLIHYRNSIKPVGNKQYFSTTKRRVERKRYFRAINREWKEQTLLLDSLVKFYKENPQPEEGHSYSLAELARDLSPIPPEFIRITIHREAPRFSLRAPRASSRSRRSPVRSAAKSGGDDNGGDGDSDQGEPPRPFHKGRIILPAPVQARQFLLTHKPNSFSLSRIVHPCRWSMRRWSA